MINKRDGSISIGAYRVSRDTDISEILAIQNAQEIFSNARFKTYQFDANSTWTVRITFEAERVRSVTLFYAKGNPREGEWTKAYEEKLLSEYELELKKCLGAPPYDFSWGRVSPAYNEKSGFSAITVIYF